MNELLTKKILKEIFIQKIFGIGKIKVTKMFKEYTNFKVITKIEKRGIFEN